MSTFTDSVSRRLTEVVITDYCLSTLVFFHSFKAINQSINTTSMALNPQRTELRGAQIMCQASIALQHFELYMTKKVKVELFV